MFSYTFSTHRFPHPVTVDSGASTLPDAFNDLRDYIRQAHGQEYMPNSPTQIVDHNASKVA